MGGLDYGTVRTGAFMGLRMLSNVADARQRTDRPHTSPAKPRAPALANGNGPVQPQPIGVLIAEPYINVVLISFFSFLCSVFFMC